MAKCMHRWVDPTQGRSPSAQGPYTCGRRPGHRGVHAWDGNGAAALWTDSGQLCFAVQMVNPPRPEGWLPALVDKDQDADELLAESVDDMPEDPSVEAQEA